MKHTIQGIILILFVIATSPVYAAAFQAIKIIANGKHMLEFVPNYRQSLGAGRPQLIGVRVSAADNGGARAAANAGGVIYVPFWKVFGASGASAVHQTAVSGSHEVAHHDGGAEINSHSPLLNALEAFAMAIGENGVLLSSPENLGVYRQLMTFQGTANDVIVDSFPVGFQNWATLFSGHLNEGYAESEGWANPLKMFLSTGLIELLNLHLNGQQLSSQQQVQVPLLMNPSEEALQGGQAYSLESHLTMSFSVNSQNELEVHLHDTDDEQTVHIIRHTFHLSPNSTSSEGGQPQASALILQHKGAHNHDPKSL